MEPSESSQTSATSQRRDLSTWLTKQQAADAIGCSTKTVEALAKEAKLQQASWRRPTGGPPLAVYHPADVQRIAQERQPGATAFVLPADGATNGNGHHVQAAINTGRALEPARLPVAGDDVLRAVFAAALRAVTSESSQKAATTWVTIAEAVELTGLPEPALRRLLKTKVDEVLLIRTRDKGLMVRRRDLELL